MFFTILAALAAEVAAQPPTEAPILRIEGATLYAAVGASDGVFRGASVDLYRAVEAIDPGSGRAVVDYFPAGTAVVSEVGATMSMLVAEPSVVFQLQVGDLVRLRQGSAPVTAAPPAAPTAAAAAPERDAPPPRAAEVVVRTDPDIEALREAFVQAAGADDERKLFIWTGYLQRWPGSALSEAVRAEVAALNRSLQQRDPELPSLSELDVAAVSPPLVRPGEPVPVTLSVSDPAQLRGAQLNYRRIGESAYRFVEMSPRGDTAFGAEIPAEAVVEPGLEWKVLLVGADESQGEAEIGNADGAPLTVGVEADPLDAPAGERSRVSVFYEYVDFYQLAGVDQYHHFEADFLYRIYSPLYSVRVGYGVYNGVSGDAETIELARAADYDDITQPVGYNFGYTELELRAVEWFAVIVRGLVGVDREGLAAGAQGRLRLGPEAGTNLVAGAARVGNIGNEYLIQLSWDTVEKVPMSAAVHVTNQPGVSPDDLGVRLVYEARYALTDWLEVGGRAGYQLRNINHTGPSFGGSAVFSW